MNIVNKRLTLAEFNEYVQSYNLGSKPAEKLVIHHTWRPTKAQWQGQKSILGLKGYYERKNWKVGPHLLVAEDGIWLFTPMRKDGIHAKNLNHRSIGIEVVGDYNSEKWTGKTKENALGAIKILMNQLDLTANEIYFHRDVSGKSCPGWAITKEWLFYELEAYRLKPRIPGGGLSDILKNTTAPIPIDYYASDEMVLIEVPDWAQEATDFVARHKLFKIRKAEDVRDAVKFHRFYQIIQQTHGQ